MPLLRLRRIAGKSKRDNVSGPDQPGSDAIDDSDKVVDAELVDDNDKGMYRRG
jgi:hypothetical protein